MRGTRCSVLTLRAEAAWAAGVSDTKLAPLDHGERRELSTAYERTRLESFVAWAALRRTTIEPSEPVRPARRDDRSQEHRRDETAGLIAAPSKMRCANARSATLIASHRSSRRNADSGHSEATAELIRLGLVEMVLTDSGCGYRIVEKIN